MRAFLRSFLQPWVKWFRGWLHGGPHFVVGDPRNPYLLRWYVIPRNPVCNLYLHKFMRDDEDRAGHDHPWPSLSILLRGRYREVLYRPDAEGTQKPYTRVLRAWPRSPVVFRSATHVHRVELVNRKPAWTLFLTGPRVREWGFHCAKGRWVHWKDFTKPENYGEVGRGCGEPS
jgi:hypothetical protein